MDIFALNQPDHAVKQSKVGHLLVRPLQREGCHYRKADQAGNDEACNNETSPRHGTILWPEMRSDRKSHSVLALARAQIKIRPRLNSRQTPVVPEANLQSNAHTGGDAGAGHRPDDPASPTSHSWVRSFRRLAHDSHEPRATSNIPDTKPRLASAVKQRG